MLTPTLDASEVAEILLRRYDRNRDGVLSLKAPVEVQSEAGGLSSLDKDGDQLLTRTELRGYLDLTQDADLPLALGGDGKRQKGTAAPRFRLRPNLQNGFRLQVGTREIKIQRKNRNPAQDENRLRMQDFDSDSNKSLDKNEFAAIQDRPDFAAVDANHDEMITAAEFDSFFLLRSKAAAVQILLDAEEEGSDLFKSLDKNGDHVLTPRELLLAVQLLDSDDQDKDGYLGGAEMSYNLKLELSRGTPRTINANLLQRPTREPKVRVDRSGPSWFLKMDRNRDGDVGLPEFPGSRRTFAALDTDHDGLISPNEATAFQPLTK
jgi:Ca2+-binding EF-hand superfamily protein